MELKLKHVREGEEESLICSVGVSLECISGRFFQSSHEKAGEVFNLSKKMVKGDLAG